MIYTVISNIFGCAINEENSPLCDNDRVFSISSAKAIDGNKESGDCCKMQQSLPELPRDIREYINNTKNEKVKAERRLAYTTLLCSLSVFFDIKDVKIQKDSLGKPFLIGLKENISFNISHSEGTVAVTLSDEGDVGVDLQAEVDKKLAEKLDRRFLHGLNLHNHPIPISFFYCTIENNLACFTEILPPDSNSADFTERWSALESLLKLNGGGFGNLSEAKEISKTTKTSIKKLYINGKKFALSISVKTKKRI